ncbi:MAG TPA: flotillin [Cyanobacteria bacterium UBA8530]|nr:flotillin [Cyanobacteria bacterium UBA8530]
MFLAFIIASVAVITILALLGLVGSMYQRVGPNQALVVYGWGGTEIITGSGKMVVPLFQSYEMLSLELMSFDVAPEQDLYSSQGVAVTVEAVAQIKIKSDPESIRTAAEQLLKKSSQDREGLIRLVMEGHLRGIVGLLTIEQIVKEPEMVAGRFRQTVADDLSKMGLEVVSFTIKKVMDEQQYIVNMGLPDVSKITREAEIARAEAERDITIKRAAASREAAIAQASADQERVIAQAASETKQAEAVRDLNMKKAQYDALVNEQRAVADKAFEIATNQSQQRVAVEEVKIEQAQKQEKIKVSQLEVQRRELELESTLIKQSLAEQQQIQILAEADRQKTAIMAAGQADALREKGKAEAEIITLKGKAEAEIILLKGQAEAAAMQLRAEAYQQYSQAAILDRVVSGLPEMARSYSEALSKVDKIVIVSNGEGKGASALTGEVTKMIAQMPEVIETLTGLKIGELWGKLPGALEQKEQPANIGSMPPQ